MYQLEIIFIVRNNNGLIIHVRHKNIYLHKITESLKNN